jgi:transcriptional regulator GlxA family with amidase domain
LGAICAGPTHLALAGILNNYKYTTSLTPEYYKENDKPDPFPRNNFIQERCVCDKHIITADGIALVDFADAIVNYLGIFDARKYSRKDFRKDFTPVWK